MIIDADGASTAMLFTADRQQAAEFNAGTEEVAVMSAGAADWDRALAGSTSVARAAAMVYELDV